MPAFTRASVAQTATGVLLATLVYTTSAAIQPPKKVDSPQLARVAVGRFKVPDNLSKDVTADTLTDILRVFGAGGLRHEAVSSTEALKEVIERIVTDGKLTGKSIEGTAKAARFVLLPTVSGDDADGYLMTATVYDVKNDSSRVVTVEEKADRKGTRLDRLRGLAQELWRQFDAPALKATIKPQGSVCLLAWSPDGKLLAIGTDRKTTEVWDADGTHKVTLKENSALCAVTWSPDNKLLATAWDDNTVKVWRGDGTQEANIQYDGRMAAWSPDGKLLATASVNTAKVWGADGTFKAALKHNGKVSSMSWSPDGKLLATGSDDKTVQVWFADGTFKANIKTVSEIYSVSWSTDGKLLATWSGDGMVRVWDFDGKLKTVFNHERKVISSMSWSPGCKLLATGSYEDHMVRVWFADGSLKANIKNLSGFCSVTWSPDGKLLATGSESPDMSRPQDNNVKLWAANGTLVLTLKETFGSCMDWSLDGKLATVSVDHLVKAWDFSPPK